MNILIFSINCSIKIEMVNNQNTSIQLIEIERKYFIETKIK